MERTLIVIKPDAVARGLVGEILSRFERRDLKIVELRMQTMNRKRAESFYEIHKDKLFFNELVSFISSGPVVGAIIEGRGAIAMVRRMVGATRSWENEPGTIRGDYATGLLDNAIHASDSRESFERESKSFFS
jgi:nucleoside-diphosphate kinase